jgi:hypothetical protein
LQLSLAQKRERPPHDLGPRADATLDPVARTTSPLSGASL